MSQSDFCWNFFEFLNLLTSNVSIWALIASELECLAGSKFLATLNTTLLPSWSLSGRTKMYPLWTSSDTRGSWMSSFWNHLGWEHLMCRYFSRTRELFSTLIIGTNVIEDLYMTLHLVLLHSKKSEEKIWVCSAVCKVRLGLNPGNYLCQRVSTSLGF